MFHVLFGAIGSGYLVYGKKQRRAVAFLAGIGLCVVPYFFDSILLLVLFGIVLMALPWLIRE